jgi:hypothetical protein
MSDENQLFSYQGYVYLGGRGASGKILNPVWIGDATLQVAMEVQTAEHTEHFSGQRLPYGRMVTKKSANATLTLFEARPEALALALYANRVETAAGTASDEALPADLSAGMHAALVHPMVSNLVITDSDGAPATLVEGVDYTLENAAGGLIKILDVGSYVQPFLASYDYEAVEQFGIYNEFPDERWVQMVGVNTLNGSPVIVDLYRVRFDPANQLPLHNDEFGSFELSGSCLVDAMLAASGALGGFGAVTRRKED